MHEQYKRVLKEYIELKHMSRVVDQSEEFRIYLPYHGIIKLTSSTTSLRAVLNGSSKTTSGYSLNECIMTGPVVQPELIDIIIGFRQYRFVLTRDIVKMCRQVWIRPEQRNMQCILWRDDPNQPIETYQLNTVTFGITSSPFLATRCLSQLADDFVESNPIA